MVLLGGRLFALVGSINSTDTRPKLVLQTCLPSSPHDLCETIYIGKTVSSYLESYLLKYSELEREETLILRKPRKTFRSR